MSTPNRSTRTTLAALATVAAPVVLLVAGAIHPEGSSDPARQLDIVAANSGRWYAAHLLFIIGFALMIPASLAVAARLRQSGPGLQAWGSALAVTGATAMVGFMAVEGLVTWELARATDRAAAAGIFDAIINGGAVLAPFAIAGLALQAGLFVIAVGLQRTRTVPSWVAATLGGSAIALAIGFATQISVLLILGNVALVVAFAAIGARDLGRGDVVGDGALSSSSASVLTGVGR